MDSELWLALPSFIALYLQPLIVSFHSRLRHSENVENRSSLCLPINWIMSLCHVPCAVIMWKLWFGAQGSLDIQGLLLHWISKWEMKYWHCSFTQYQCSLHTEVEWVWRTLKLDSVFTTRVHQSLSFLRSLTISGIPEGPWFSSYRMIYALSCVIQTVGFKEKTRWNWFSFILTWCATTL